MSRYKGYKPGMGLASMKYHKESAIWLKSMSRKRKKSFGRVALKSADDAFGVYQALDC